MPDVIIIGAGLNGLATAMLLALDGHNVTVLERDPAPPVIDAEQAWKTWERRGVNQFRLPHFLLPRWRELLDRELPGVVANLEAAGALRWNWLAALPDSLTCGTRDGDDRHDVLTGRRPLVEGVLATTAASTYGVTVRRGVAVAGLLEGSPEPEGIPRVVGVTTTEGEHVYADLVVDSTGRRSPLPSWLKAIGGRPPLEVREDSGFVYYCRHFRSPDGAMPELSTPLTQLYPSISIVTLPCDHGTWGTVLLTSGRDHELRALRDVDTWHRTIARYPAAAAWAEGEPFTGVDVMAKLEDRYRRFVVDEQPVVTGLLAVGDAWACTNPSLGRGASIGLLHGVTLRDLLREVPAQESYKLALRWDEVTETTVAPLYRLTLAFDRHRLAEIDADAAGQPYEPDDPSWSMTKAIGIAARHDPDVLRSFLSIVGLLETPAEVLDEPGMFERVVEHAAEAPRYGLGGLERQELLEVVSR